MIYLLRTAGINTEHKAVLVLKIGYTDDLRGDGRFQDYKNAGMDIEILHTISGGNTYLEHELQRKFQAHRLPWKSLEWFEDCEEILDAFSGFSNIDDISALLGYVNFEEFERSRIRKSEKELYQESLESIIHDLGENDKSSIFYKKLLDLKTFTERLKFICKCTDSNIVSNVLMYIHDSFYEEAYSKLGPNGCSACGFGRSKEIDRLLNNQDIDISSDILSRFEVGKKYSLTEIKEYLSNLYLNAGFKSNAKATDISKYFELKPTQLLVNLDGEKKKVRAFEILSIK